MFEAYKKKSTWTRIGVLLAVLAGLVVLPALVSIVWDLFNESDPPTSPGFLNIVGSHRFRLSDWDDDGRIDCALRVPALPWARRGYAREGTTRCDHKGVKTMPEAMATLADEALRLRREHGLSIGELLDVDGDDRVDCIEFDGTWLYVVGARCPDKMRKDAAPLSDDRRDAADRLLLVEREIRDRWLEPPRQ